MGRLGVALALAALATAAHAEEERGHCTAMGVGRKATSTGSTLLAHTDDRHARLAHAAAGVTPAAAAPRKKPQPAPAPARLRARRPCSRAFTSL